MQQLLQHGASALTTEGFTAKLLIMFLKERQVWPKSSTVRHNLQINPLAGLKSEILRCALVTDTNEDSQCKFSEAASSPALDKKSWKYFRYQLVEITVK